MDAALFPLLDPLDFAQEGHHVAFTQTQQGAERRGVVYNEMYERERECVCAYCGFCNSFSYLYFCVYVCLCVCGDCRKGAMADQDSTFQEEMASLLFPPESPYHHNSGGAPAAIPSLTHAELVAFHRRHYSPENAKFFLYGDRPVQKSLDIINEYVMKRHAKDAAASRRPRRTAATAAAAAANATAAAPLLELPRVTSITQARATLPLTARRACAPVAGAPADAADDGDGDAADDGDGAAAVATAAVADTANASAAPNADDASSTIGVSYLLRPTGKCSVYEPLSLLRARVLSSLLLSGQSAPLYKALVESGLTKTLTDASGFDESRIDPTFTIAASGVAPANFQRVRDAIATTLRECVRDGFPAERVEAIFHRVELQLAHKDANFGMRLFQWLVLPLAHADSLARRPDDAAAASDDVRVERSLALLRGDCLLIVCVCVWLICYLCMCITV